jgi:hypothetical protein
MTVFMRIVFFLLTFHAIRTGDLLGIGITLVGFLIMESFCEDREKVNG